MKALYLLLKELSAGFVIDNQGHSASMA